jgi:hypothetical protein
VESVDAAVEAVWRLPELDRVGVRAEFDRRFSAERMASDYVEIYRSLTGVRREAARLHAVEDGPALAAVA